MKSSIDFNSSKKLIVLKRKQTWRPLIRKEYNILMKQIQNIDTIINLTKQFSSWPHLSLIPSVSLFLFIIFSLRIPPFLFLNTLKLEIKIFTLYNIILFVSIISDQRGGNWKKENLFFFLIDTVVEILLSYLFFMIVRVFSFFFLLKIFLF